MLYGTLFMMCGAYTLAQNGHVRADFVYMSRPRGQAALDLALYFLFFIPGIIGLIYAGYGYAGDSWRIREHSNITADGPPVYHFKTVSQLPALWCCSKDSPRSSRCIVCLRTGAWPARLEDVEEIDVIDEQLSHSEYVDEESRRWRWRRARRRRGCAPSQCHGRERGPRARHQRGRTEKVMSDPVLGLTMLGFIVVAIMMGFPTAFTLMGLGHHLRLHRFLGSLSSLLGQ